MGKEISAGRQYGAVARIGLIVPPANSTVEPELTTLMPDASRFAFYAARLAGTVGTNIDAGIRERQAQYDASLPEVAQSLNGLKLDVAWLAHTASTYIAAGDETDILAGLSRSGARQLVTAAGVIREALEVGGCRRLGIVSAYPDWLTGIAEAFWRSQGIEVVEVRHIRGNPSIYAVRPEQVVSAAREIHVDTVDAILVSGTGVPTLRALDALAAHPAPVLSSNLCFGWWVYRQFQQTPGPARPACLQRLLQAWG